MNKKIYLSFNCLAYNKISLIGPSINKKLYATVIDIPSEIYVIVASFAVHNVDTSFLEATTVKLETESEEGILTNVIFIKNNIAYNLTKCIKNYLYIHGITDIEILDICHFYFKEPNQILMHNELKHKISIFTLNIAEDGSIIDINNP